VLATHPCTLAGEHTLLVAEGLICRTPTLTAGASHSGMSSLISCEEMQQLKREYDRSLRVWAHYAFPLPGDVLELPRRLAQLKYDAQLDRDIAAKHLSAHQGNCPVCSRTRSGGRMRLTPAQYARLKRS
jgi:hypothetical protein